VVLFLMKSRRLIFTLSSFVEEYLSAHIYTK